ncbi:MAG: hypothetical protein CME71_12290 [Halobacteriovorax sp.]|nr:hypothetical protein [Halobacteriovorax sp.]
MCHYVAMKAFTALLLLTSSVSLADMAPKAIFGPDNRTALDSYAYPFGAVVRLVNTEGGHCSGSLIGRDLVLTNSHCMIEESGSAKKSIQATIHGLPGYSPKVAVSSFISGTRDYKDEPRFDWALARLKEPIGDVVGWFRLANAAKVGSGFTLAGFSGDFKRGEVAGVHAGCSLKGPLGGLGVMMHDCDMTKGASGSSIWKIENKLAYIHALNSAQLGKDDEHDHWSEEASNLSVPVETFLDQAKQELAASISYDAGLVICNTRDKKDKFAFGFYNASLSVSKGWVSIAANECAQVKLPKPVAKGSESYRIYSYAKEHDINGEFSREYCTGGFFPFEKNEGDCSNSKIKMFTSIGNTKPGHIIRIDL